jgi:hypothetical protein
LADITIHSYSVDSDISQLTEKLDNVRFELEEHPVDVVRPIKVGVLSIPYHIGILIIDSKIKSRQFRREQHARGDPCKWVISKLTTLFRAVHGTFSALLVFLDEELLTCIDQVRV